MGWGPMNYIKENLLPNVGFEPNRPDGDMLHYITYPTDSLLHLAGHLRGVGGAASDHVIGGVALQAADEDGGVGVIR